MTSKRAAVVNIYDAKARLSALVEQAAAGHDVIIGRAGRPVARLTRLEEPKRTVRFGGLKGKFKVAPDFDVPLPEALLAAFEGE
jgi:prevent-host-death family protein